MSSTVLLYRRSSGLTDEEVQKIDKFCKELVLKSAVGAVFYPLSNVKTLFQLGFEPFPLSTGKMFGIGREAYFLPNGLSYVRSVFKKYGLSALYNGVDAGITASIVGTSVTFLTSMYLDRYYPSLGGDPLNLDKDEKELTDGESARRVMRFMIRDVTARTVGGILARPFVVVMVRKIAQLIGGEAKYTNVISSLYVIGREEGPAGFFSGLVPQLIADFITVAGAQTLVFVIERGLRRIQVEGDKESEEMISSARKGLHLVAPFIVNTFSYPFSVVGSVMAVGGSGLAVAMLPYSPSFTMWQDAWSYLTPYQGLKRGSRMFFREHAGAVSVGTDQLLYASNKHFV